MPKFDFEEYDPYGKWPDGLRKNIDLISGSPLTSLVLAAMHCYPDETFNSVKLQELFKETQQSDERVPTLAAFWRILKRLGTESNMVEVTSKPNTSVVGRITPEGQAQGAGFAGPFMQLCLAHPDLRPQDIVGHGTKVKKRPEKDKQQDPDPALASIRVALYALLNKVEPITVTEIDVALNTDKCTTNYIVRRLGKVGVLERKKASDCHQPSLVQFSDAYRDSFSQFASSVEALGTPGGIVDGLDAAEAVVGNPEAFATLLSNRPMPGNMLSLQSKSEYLTITN